MLDTDSTDNNYSYIFKQDDKDNKQNVTLVPYNAFQSLVDSYRIVNHKKPNNSNFKQDFDAKSHDIIYCTGFKDADYSSVHHFKSRSLKQGQRNPVSNYIEIVFHFTDKNEFQDIKRQVKALNKQLGCDYMFYPDIRPGNKNTWYYVIPTNLYLTRDLYHQKVRAILQNIATEDIVNVEKSEDPFYGIPLFNADYSEKDLKSVDYHFGHHPYMIDKFAWMVDMSKSSNDTNMVSSKPTPTMVSNDDDKSNSKSDDKSKKTDNQHKEQSLYTNFEKAASKFVSLESDDRYAASHTGFNIFSKKMDANKVNNRLDKMNSIGKKLQKFEAKNPNHNAKDYDKKKASKLTNQYNQAKNNFFKYKRIYHKQRKILTSIATATVAKPSIISDKTAKNILHTFDTVLKDGVKNKTYEHMFKAIKSTLTQRTRYLAEPVSEAVRLYQLDDSSVSLGEQLVTILGSHYKKDPKQNVGQICEDIIKIFPPALLETSNPSDIDNVVIFDPMTGYWTNDRQKFASILQAVKPFADQKAISVMMTGFAGYARNHNRYIEPYHGNRYLLYNNGVFDTVAYKHYVQKKSNIIKQNQRIKQQNRKRKNLNEKPLPTIKLPKFKLISIRSDLVHDLHFTERAFHRINIKINPPLPKYDDLQTPIQNKIYNLWTPEKMLDGYSGNDLAIKNYFMFCMSLALFSTHNFGVALDIKGASGYGKSYLRFIFNSIFGSNRINPRDFSALNGRFVFTSYRDDTALIWFKEANYDSKPLDSRGISTYDTLCDDQARFEVKNKGDKLVDNPPMVIVEGTGFLKTKHPDAGPYRRTLVMVLPKLTQVQKNRFYAKNFKTLLQKTDVVQYLNWKMIEAYCKRVPESDLKGDFKMNMIDQNTIKQIHIPKKAMKWRNNLKSFDNNMADWFTNCLEPALNPTIGDKNPSKDLTRVHPIFLWHLYAAHMQSTYNIYINDNMNPDEFMTAFKEIAQEHDWYLFRLGVKGQKGSKQDRHVMRKLSTINFNGNAYEESEKLPSMYRADGKIKFTPFSRNLRNWYYIEKIPEGTNK